MRCGETVLHGQIFSCSFEASFMCLRLDILARLFVWRQVLLIGPALIWSLLLHWVGETWPKQTGKVSLDGEVRLVWTFAWFAIMLGLLPTLPGYREMVPLACQETGCSVVHSHSASLLCTRC